MFYLGYREVVSSITEFAFTTQILIKELNLAIKHISDDKNLA